MSQPQAPPEIFTDTAALTDVDGTLSDTRTHMEGYNERLQAAFPEIPEDMLSDLGAARVAYRKQWADLTHAQQSQRWEANHPGLKFDSQTAFFEGEAPEVFTPELMRRIREWGADPANFGHGEYDDNEAYFQGLRRIGAMPVLFTLGSREHSNNEPGWQYRKIASGPHMAGLAAHIAEEMPLGGKGELVTNWHDEPTDTFHIPRTDGGGPIVARNVALVDDVFHNLEELPDEALGILVDRKGKYEGKPLPSNVEVARSLEEVPDMIDRYQQLRQSQLR